MRLTAHAGFGGRLHGPAVQPTLHALRHGAMPALFAGVRAPSTLGSFLRSFTWGNARQMKNVHREFLAELARRRRCCPAGMSWRSLISTPSRNGSSGTTIS